uniref:Immunoglobulin domain-containing protein n=1 Tax=Echeneis naucrates TaxID=173247 RepID=A0A665TCP4_ECHNA
GPLFTGPEGGNGRINCHFNRPGSRMSLCRNKCKDEDILIRTDKSWASNGKYSIRYKEIKSHAGAIVSVLIRNLTQSDSGWYFCGLGGSTGRDSFEDFEIRVSNAPTTKPTTSFSSGRSTMSTDFPEATSQPSSAGKHRGDVISNFTFQNFTAFPLSVLIQYLVLLQLLPNQTKLSNISQHQFHQLPH